MARLRPERVRDSGGWCWVVTVRYPCSSDVQFFTGEQEAKKEARRLKGSTGRAVSCEYKEV